MFRGYERPVTMYTPQTRLEAYKERRQKAGKDCDPVVMAVINLHDTGLEYYGLRVTASQAMQLAWAIGPMGDMTAHRFCALVQSIKRIVGEDRIDTYVKFDFSRQDDRICLYVTFLSGATTMQASELTVWMDNSAEDAEAEAGPVGDDGYSRAYRVTWE